jgi:ankyrin repeat protein
MVREIDQYPAGHRETEGHTMATKKQVNAALVKAVRAGDVSAVEDALRAGADPNVHAGYASALSDAANYRADVAVARAMTRALLDAGADPNARHSAQWDDRPIFFAAAYGDAEVVRLLWARGGVPRAHDGSFARNSDGETLLAPAAQGGHLWLVDACLAAGMRADDVDIHGSTPLHYAMQKTRAGGTHADKDCAALATRLLAHGAPLEHHRRGDWGTALHWAAEYGDASGVRCLLAHGADREAATEHAQKRPLHAAAARGPVACALALLEAGASVHATTRRGETALHLAAARTRFAELDSAGLLEALVAAGADLRARDTDGWTPLGRALSGLYTPRVAVTLRPTQRALLAALVALDGPCDDVGSWGATLAHVAACCDDAALLAAALAKGAAPNPRDADGYTPLHLAAMSGGPETVRALLDAGADRAAVTLKRRTELGVVLGKGATAAKIAKALGRAEVAAML